MSYLLLMDVAITLLDSAVWLIEEAYMVLANALWAYIGPSIMAWPIF